jgi:hypothetical protein
MNESFIALVIFMFFPFNFTLHYIIIIGILAVEPLKIKLLLSLLLLLFCLVLYFVCLFPFLIGPWAVKLARN